MAAESDINRLNVSLYVGDLHPMVNEVVLKDFFSQAGQVKYLRICRDSTSQQSLGYAYVNFKTHEQAAAAIENLNYEPIINRPCRIMWAQRDPNIRISGKYNLFVKNLGTNVTQRQLYDSCELFGTILSAKIATDEHGNSKGYGFVHFATEEAYKSAMEFLRGYKVDGTNKNIYAGPFIPKSERKSLFDPSKFNNCFIKNFNDALDDDKLRKLFEKYGKIISCVVMKDDTGKSKGFGFVCFESSDDAMKACEELNNTEIDGNTIYVGKAIRREKRIEEVRKKQEKIREERKSKYSGSVNLYVKNLELTLTDEDLHQTFSKFGEITSAKVMKNENGKSRGFGFVCFKEADSATRAVSEMKNSLVGNKPLYVAIAQRKEERHNKLIEVFKTQFEEMNQFTPNYYPNQVYNQAGRYFPNNVIPNRRSINPMNQSMIANQMGPSQYPGPQSGMGHLNAYLRPSTRFPVAANMAQPMANSNVRNMNPRPNISNFNPHNQMTNRMVAANTTVIGGMPNMNANVKYNHNARNVTVPGLDERKARLGNRLMPIVNKYYPENSSRLTGILLSMDANVLEKLLEDEGKLKIQIDETNARLRSREENTKKAEGN